MSYERIAARIKHDLDTELGFTFSVGLAPNKVLAKSARSGKSPLALPRSLAVHIHRYLEHLPVENIWGIGPNTTAFLQKHRIHTALEYRSCV